MIKSIDIDYAVEQILRTREYGDILSYEYLENLLEANREDMEFTIKLSKLKNILIECGYVLSCLINEGYKILMPNEIADEVMNKCVKSSLKKIDKGLKIMKYTDRRYLKEDELAVFEAFENTLNKMYRENENSILDMQVMLNSVKQKELGD